MRCRCGQGRGPIVPLCSFRSMPPTQPDCAHVDAHSHSHLPTYTLHPTVGKDYALFTGYAHLSAGLVCGLSGLAAGIAIGIVGDAGVRANGQQPKLYVGMILILIFAEALGLYGLIVAIVLSQANQPC